MIVLVLLIAGFSAATKDADQLDPANDVMLIFKERTAGPVGLLTTTSGEAVSYREATNTLNTKLNNNHFLMELITRVNRERIPERIVHTKGAGAFGYFEVTHDLTHICKADFLKYVGMKTPVAVRFSLDKGERGTSELELGSRGFAIKFYTKEGNFDLVGINTPVSFCKDPIQFPNFAHAFSRHPSTNLYDPNTFWDAVSLAPEALYTFIRLRTGLGTPASYRNMPGFGAHTYQVVNSNGTSHFVRFHILPDAGIKNFGMQEARDINAMDPDYLTRDLFRAIGNGDFPSWTVSVQILTQADVKKAGSRVFDITRTISLKDFPLHPVGKLYLNRNPKNFHAEVEQLALCPGHLVRGILGAPDTVFEMRQMAYRDAQLYRLGANFENIQVNCPFQVKTLTYTRDGVPPVGDNEGDITNYYPNSFHGPVPFMDTSRTSLIDIIEKVGVDNFDQVTELYANGMSDDDRTRVIDELVSNLRPTYKFIQGKLLKLFNIIHPDLAYRVSRGLNYTEP